MSKSKKNIETKEELPAVRERKFLTNDRGEKFHVPPVVVRTDVKGEFRLDVDSGTSFKNFGTCYKKLIEVNSANLGFAVGVNNEATDDDLKNNNAALAFIASNKPQDSVELLLLSQMYAVHNLSLKMAGRAIFKDQTEYGVEQNINRVNKLSRTFAIQVEALNKHRTKGKQKIVVQHVHINKGGQAVVGDINQGVGNE